MFCDLEHYLTIPSGSKPAPSNQTHITATKFINT